MFGLFGGAQVLKRGWMREAFLLSTAFCGSVLCGIIVAVLYGSRVFSYTQPIFAHYVMRWSPIDPEAHWTRIGLARLGVRLETARRLRRRRRLVSRRGAPDPCEYRVRREPAPALLSEVPAQARFVLGDRHYNTPELHENCAHADRLLVTTRYGCYPHTDDGVEVRRIFHKLRSLAMENVHEHFEGIFDGHGQVPTKGVLAAQRFALGAIFVYQLALLYRSEHALDLCVGLNAFLKAA
jgi:hypothetical protein